MAKLERKTNLTLELTPEEVATLYVILMNIGGDPGNSPRQYCDSMLIALGGCTDGKPTEVPYGYNASVGSMVFSETDQPIIEFIAEYYKKLFS